MGPVVLLGDAKAILPCSMYRNGSLLVRMTLPLKKKYISARLGCKVAGYRLRTTYSDAVG